MTKKSLQSRETKRNLIIILAIVAILLVGTYIIFISGVFLPKEIPAKTYNISIMDFAFNPVILTIRDGDTIIWTNKDSMPHTITSDTGNELNSPNIESGQTYSHIFNNKGDYNYHCSIHTQLRAIIIVE